MADILLKDGIGFAQNTGAAFYTDTAKSTFTTPREKDLYLTKAWSPWYEEDDSEPEHLQDDIENCGVLSAGVEMQARLAVGKGPEPYLLTGKDAQGNESLEYVMDSEILDFMEENESYQHGYKNIYNNVGYGWGATQMLMNAGYNRINRIQSLDVYDARLEKKKNGIIKNIYLCDDWGFAPAQVDKDRIKSIPILQEGFELQQLQSGVSANEYVLLHRLLKNGRAYYPKPLHRSAKAWVDITKSVPAQKKAINANQMSIKYLIHISDTYWPRAFGKWHTMSAEEQESTRRKKYTEINTYLTGEINQGKSIIAGKYFNEMTQKVENDIDIQVIDDKMKDGKGLIDSAVGDKQILFSMFSNPAIFGSNLLGDGASGGAGSGSDIREATLVLLMLLHPERQQNLRIYNLVKKFNGWDKRLEKERSVVGMYSPGITSEKKVIPRLVFRYGSSILTTLDTGGSTKPVTN